MIQVLVFVLVLAAIGGGIFLLVFDGKMPSKKTKQASTNANNKETSKNKGAQEKSKEKEQQNILKVQDFLDFDNIEIFSKDNPMGAIVRDNNSEFIGVIEVLGINYNLLSIEEREMLEDSFAKLLNGLDYPIQIHVQSRKLDIEEYGKKYSERLEEIKKNYDSLVAKLNFLKDNDGALNEIIDMEDKINRTANQYNYGQEIKAYIMARSESKNMLERKYYIILTHRHNKGLFEEELTYKEILNNAFYDIANKANSLISALSRANLGGKILSGMELAELLYTSYNKSESGIYKLSQAIRSQFNHLYVTAAPVELKKLAREVEKLEKLEREQEDKINTIIKEQSSYLYDVEDSKFEELEIEDIDRREV